ncbi:MAG TPA: hypothetical protein ENF95_01850 [Candidatus Aenigmarchaeota archaeon]|nr:hypothetical protein [Candidatus Aenigmarchaeota archaeon]
MIGKKGQSALEYLMTYGWAILIIIIVGGVLYYYGVFSPGKLVGKSKVGFSDVDVDAWTIDTSGATPVMKIKLVNKVGKDINITDITVASGATTDSNTTVNEKVSAGEKSSFIPITLSNLNPSSGSAYKYDVTITYYITEYGPGTTFKSAGTLSGTA